MPTRYTDYDENQSNQRKSRPVQRDGYGYEQNRRAGGVYEGEARRARAQSQHPTPSLGEYEPMRRTQPGGQGYAASSGARRPTGSAYDPGARQTASGRQTRSSYDPGVRRPVGSQTRTSAYDTQPRRPAGSQPQRRPVRQDYADAQPQRRSQAGGQARPVRTGYGQTGGSQPQRRVREEEYARPRRPVQLNSGQNRQGAGSGVQRRPDGIRKPGYEQADSQNQRRQQGSYASNYSGYSGGGSPVIKWISGILCVALLITVCLAITSKIRSQEPQPVITQNTDAAGSETMQPTNAPETTDAPAATDEPAGTVLPAATDVPANPVSASGRSVTIRAIGDVIIMEGMLDTAAVDKKNKIYDFSPLFSMAGEVMSDADWTIINIESTLREGKYGYSGYPQFSTPHSILQDLKNVGVDMLTMCNNHALDGYFDGLKMSLDYADEAGLKHVGAYRTQKEHDTPEVYELGGIQVGMLNYTQALNSMDKHSDEAATIYGLRTMKNADYAGDIADLRSAGAEAVVVFMHWGEEYNRYPEDSTVSVAKKLIAAGADIVVGGHPHVVQPAEYVTAVDANGNARTGLVLYSMGNFVSNHRAENTDNGVILEFTIQENASGKIEIVNPSVIPVYVWRMGTEGSYDYRVLPSGQYLDNPPSGMSAEEHARLKDSWNKTVELMAGVIPVVAG